MCFGRHYSIIQLLASERLSVFYRKIMCAYFLRLKIIRWVFIIGKALLLLQLVTALSSSKVWKKVYIEEEAYEYYRSAKILTSFSGKDWHTMLHISQLTNFDTLGDYVTACRLNNSNEIKLVNTMTSPKYVNKSEGLTCYTNMDVDLSVDAVPYSSMPTLPARNVSNIIDGIYAHKMGHDALHVAKKGSVYPWALLDLKDVYTVKKIILTNVDAVLPNYFLQKIEIKIGQDLETDGIFSSYELFGYFGKICEIGKEITIASKRGVTGRFVAVKTKHSHLFLMNIQIKT